MWYYLLTMQNEFIFVLGNSKKLAAAELKSILSRELDPHNVIVNDSLVTVNTTATSEAVAALIKTLGGTVKIGQLVGEGIWQHIVEDDLMARPVRDVGFSSYQSKLSKSDLLSFKAGLKNKIRVVMPREGGKLNAAEVIYNRLLTKGREYLVVDKKVYETLAVQEVEEFSSRDYDKPRGDYFSGMLPPKLARMMVNLAVGTANRPTVVDPFCGSGNVLIEALDLGYKVAGSDISQKAVNDTKANLSWLMSQNKELGIRNYGENIRDENPNSQFIIHNSIRQADATKDNFLEGIKGPVAIVGEPYLGKPKKSKLPKAEVEKEFDELAKLYLGFFENLSKICHPERREGSHQRQDSSQSTTAQNDVLSLCLVFPFCETLEGEYIHLYNRIVDKIDSLGYIKLAGPFSYGRDYQVVKREVLLFAISNGVNNGS